MSTGPEPGLPRLLTIMGSGETSPTMVRTHRELLARLGPAPVPAVLLDTPFGFQENAEDIASRAQAYFRESLHTAIDVASFRSAAGADPLARASFLAQVGAARYVFAGPGSPSYALRQWARSGLPGLLAEKLRTGGAVTFASAAALTLGLATVPVYEIYKVGETPRWLDGLDLLAEAGLRAAVIPHYNNAEGGNHDTRYCYLGERRLSALEEELAGGAFVLGVDEHTGLVLDLGAGRATVVGLGVVTVRARGRSAQLPAGTTLPIAELAERAAGLAEGGTGDGGQGAGPAAGGTGDGGQGGGEVAAPGPGDPRPSPLMAGIRDHEAAFAGAVGARDVDGAVRAILALDDELVAWSRDTLESNELDRGRDAVHAMVASLGQLAEVGARDQRAVVGPFVETLLDHRERARAGRRYEEADDVRDRLSALGVEVRDTPEGTRWALAENDGTAP
ncbi:MAG: CysS/YqeB C-terminal domain-containing protein [Acidimicrobiales bacterium]